MKIVYVIGDPGASIGDSIYSGSITHVVCLINAFRKLGNEVIPVIVGEGKKEKKAKSHFSILKRITPDTISPVMREIYKIWYNFKFYRTYKKIFQDESPDFIYERYYHFHIATSIIAKQLKIPYIVEINGPIEARKWFGPAYFASIALAIQKKIARCADAIVTVSKVMQNYLIKKGISPRKIYVLPNGVDCEVFDPKNFKGDNIRKRYNLNRKTIIGFVGSMKRYHGLEFLLKVAKEIVKSENDVYFLLVGPFKDIESFRQLLREKTLLEHFRLTGAIPFEEVPKYISAMDICVMPYSNPHGSPIKIFEYGAMGKPVIAPRFQPIEEVIKDGVNGLLFAPGSLTDAVDKIKILLINPSLRTTLGSSLKEHIQTNFTWKKNAQRILSIYESMSLKG